MPTYYVRNTMGSQEDSIVSYKKINDFFDEYVHKGGEDLKVFSRSYSWNWRWGEDLLTVKGYASPLAKSDYNVNLLNEGLIVCKII